MKDSIIRLFKRRRFVIYKKFQFTLMIISFSYVFLFCAVMGTYLFFPLMMELDESIRGSERALIAAQRILYLHEKFWPALVLTFFAIGCHSLFISHKIAGPLYRFNYIFKSITEGTLPVPIRLRKGDYLYNEMENVNHMLERLRGKLTEFQEMESRLNKSIIECKDMVGRSTNNDLIMKMEDLAREGRKLEEELSYFKVIQSSNETFKTETIGD